MAMPGSNVPPVQTPESIREEHERKLAEQQQMADLRFQVICVGVILIGVLMVGGGAWWKWGAPAGMMAFGTMLILAAVYVLNVYTTEDKQT